MKFAALHPDAWRALQSLRSRSSSSVLLAGPAGMHKTGLAIEFAAALLCENIGGEGHACGNCSACNWFSQGNHPDYRYLRPDSEMATEDADSKSSEKSRPSREIRIEQIRAIGDFLTTSTHRSGRRVVVASPAEAMNRNTANALLKALEEPQPGTVFILVSDTPDVLLPTIRSRCLKVAVSCPDRHRALELLAARSIAKAEHWLDLAGGAPGLAESLARGAEGRFLEVMNRCFSHAGGLDIPTSANEIEKLLRNESDLEMITVVTWLQRRLVDATLSQLGLPARHFSGMEGLKRQRAIDVNIKKLCENNAKMHEFKKLSKHTLNNRLFLEEILTYATLSNPTEGQ